MLDRYHLVGLMDFPVTPPAQSHEVTGPVIILRPSVPDVMDHCGPAPTGVTSGRLALVFVPHSGPFAHVFCAWALFLVGKVWIRPWMPLAVLTSPFGLWLAISILAQVRVSVPTDV